MKLKQPNFIKIKYIYLIKLNSFYSESDDSDESEEVSVCSLASSSFTPLSK